MRTQFFVCLLFLLAFKITNAQQFPVITYPVQTITWNANIGIASVTDLCVDKKGYLYIATKEGVLIWDGNRMRTITHNVADSNSLINNDVTAILPINENLIAIGTESGLEILDTRTNTFDRTIAINIAANDFSGIKYLELYGDNQLFLANENNVVVYDIQKKTQKTLNGFSGLLNSGEYVIDIIADKSNIYIISSQNIYLYSTIENKIIKVEIAVHNEEIISFAVSDKKMFVLTVVGNLYQFNKTNLELIGSQFLSKYFTPFGAYPITLINENEIWITSSLNKLNFVIKNGEIFKLELDDVADKIYSKTTFLAENGDLYIGCLNNVKLITAAPIKSEQIKFERLNQSMERRMPKNIVVRNNSIYSVDRNWMLYEHNLAVNKINTITKFPDLIAKLYMPAVYIQPVNDTAVVAGFANNSLPQSNLNKTTLINNKLSYFYYYNTKNKDYHLANFNTRFFDNQKGKYQFDAFNTNDSCIYFIKNNIIEWHHFINKKTTTITFSIDTSRYSNLFYAVFMDKAGNFWAASVNDLSNTKHTKEGCIVQYNTYTKNTKVYPAIGKFSFASSVVLDIESDNKEYLYLLNKYGVYILNYKDNSASGIYSNQQLPDYTYISMEKDVFNRLWLGTLTNGIVVYDIATQQYLQINNKQSLLSNDMIVHASTQDEENQLYFWDITGVNIFDPAKINFNLPKPAVIISDILLRGKTIVGNKLVANATEYTFSHNNNDIDFSFSLLNFNAPTNNVYSYILKGIDEEWTESGTRNFASYHNLPPGKYTFMVKGRNNLGTWSNEPATIIIHITPAFWQTIWFKLLCTFIITAIIYWIYKLRLEKALAVEKIRSRLSRDLHDDLGSTLSSISILSGLMKSKLEKKPEDVAPIIDKISDSAIKMNDSLQDLVWAVKPENDSMQELLVRMEQFASSIFESKNIQFTFTVPDQIATVKLNPEFIRNVYLIFKEAVNNTAKYSNCSKATITITEKGKLFNMQVFDNGKGFDPETIQRGNGLNNMVKRAEQIGGKIKIISIPGVRTGIILECKITS